MNYNYNNQNTIQENFNPKCNFYTKDSPECKGTYVNLLKDTILYYVKKILKTLAGLTFIIGSYLIVEVIIRSKINKIFLFIYLIVFSLIITFIKKNDPEMYENIILGMCIYLGIQLLSVTDDVSVEQLKTSGSKSINRLSQRIQGVANPLLERSGLIEKKADLNKIMKGDVSLDDFNKLSESELAKIPRDKLAQLHKLQHQQLRQKQLERLPLEQLKKMQAKQLQGQMLNKAKKQLARQAQLKRDKNLLKQLQNAKAAQRLFGNSRLGNRYSSTNIF